MGLVGFITVVLVCLLFAFIGFRVARALCDYARHPNKIRLTTIHKDGSKTTEFFDLDQLSAEEIEQLRSRLIAAVEHAKGRVDE